MFFFPGGGGGGNDSILSTPNRGYELAKGTIAAARRSAEMVWLSPIAVSGGNSE